MDLHCETLHGFALRVLAWILQSIVKLHCGLQHGCGEGTVRSRFGSRAAAIIKVMRSTNAMFTNSVSTGSG